MNGIPVATSSRAGAMPTIAIRALRGPEAGTVTFLFPLLQLFESLHTLFVVHFILLDAYIISAECERTCKSAATSCEHVENDLVHFRRCLDPPCEHVDGFGILVP